MSRPTISFVIPTYNRLEYTSPFLHSLSEAAPPDSEIILVDNGSTDGTEDFLLTFSRGRENTRVLLLGRNLGYSVANNIGAQAASGEFLLFLNNDMLALPGSFDPYIDELQKDGVGLVGGRLLYADGTIQHAGIAIHLSGHPVHRKVRMPSSNDPEVAPLEVAGITGACIGIRSGLFQKVGGFNTKYAILYQDIDLCLKVLSSRKQIIYRPDANLYHYESVTSREVKTHDVVARDWQYFKGQWPDFLRRLRHQAHTAIKGLAADRTFLIYGTGRLAILAGEMFQGCDVRPAAFVDSDQSRRGGRFLNRTIISPDEITKQFRPFVLIASMYEYDIRESLRRLDAELEISDSCFSFSQVRALL